MFKYSVLKIKTDSFNHLFVTNPFSSY